MLSALMGYELSRAARHAAVDACAQVHIQEIMVLAKAARACVNRSAGQRIRRFEERIMKERDREQAA